METLFNPNAMKLLIVDDTAANVEVLINTLRPEGYRVAFANSGEQAIKIATKLVPNLIYP